jgi:hypothetical protein
MGAQADRDHEPAASRQPCLSLRRPRYYVLASCKPPANHARAGYNARSSGTEVTVLNRTDRPTPMPGEAEVKYLDGDFRVVRPGTFVRCAVTGVSIPLEELRYWSVDLQEAYATPEAVLQRLGSRYGR